MRVPDIDSLGLGMHGEFASFVALNLYGHTLASADAQAGRAQLEQSRGHLEAALVADLEVTAITYHHPVTAEV